MRATPGDFAVAAGLRPAPGLQAVSRRADAALADAGRIHELRSPVAG